jgi:hypothetical protein
MHSVRARRANPTAPHTRHHVSVSCGSHSTLRIAAGSPEMVRPLSRTTSHSFRFIVSTCYAVRGLPMPRLWWIRIRPYTCDTGARLPHCLRSRGRSPGGQVHRSSYSVGYPARVRSWLFGGGSKLCLRSVTVTKRAGLGWSLHSAAHGRAIM